ncbi:hypothetical protein AA0121_g9632 [Alternaria tenuissima]|nr:hypothetical protein AA0121_g9632 [Alternaria tenuissima]
MASNGLPVPAQNSNYMENGRWYHGYRRGLYMYPCDEAEKDRMDIYHQFFAVTSLPVGRTSRRAESRTLFKYHRLDLIL